MRSPPSNSLPLARLIIAEELQPDNPSDTGTRAAFRACENLRQSLSNLIGAVGFRLLLTRALVLARRESQWLERLTVSPGGVVVCPIGGETASEREEAGKGAEALIAQLLGLLTMFIGAALTQQLVLDSWPKASLNSAQPRATHEKAS